jgi:branched-chain amino acid transport system ATP-binding protein
LALLEVRELSKSFGGIRAVDDCSFAVEAGSITALIGPNGAGKTTVFNLISGLHRPDGGAILFDGARIDGLAPHRITRRGLARTFQISRDLAGLSVLENVIVQAPARGPLHLLEPAMSAAERERALELLSFLGIVGLAYEPAAKLSYGQ